VAAWPLDLLDLLDLLDPLDPLDPLGPQRLARRTTPPPLG
jgi:hypothetical protein